MRLLPRTLFRQNLLLMVLLIFVGQLASGLIFVFAVQKPRVEMLAEMAANHLVALQAAASQIPQDGRRAFIEALNRQLFIQLFPASAVPLDLVGMDSFAEPKSRAVRLFARALQKRLAGRADLVRWLPSDNSLWVGLLLRDEPYWVRLDPRRFNPAAPWLLAGVSLACALLAVSGAIWMSRRLNRPLARLVQAAEIVGLGGHPPPLEESGTSEIATVAATFNRMAGNLAQADNERVIMLAGVSHDVRTPLTKLRLALDISEARLEPGLFRQMVRYVEDIDGLLDQFLDFARVGNEELPTEIEPDAMIAEVAADFALRGHVFRLALAGPARMALRPRAMHRLLVNLFDNAVKYGEHGLAVRSELTDGAWRLSVIDSGPGIPENMVERLLLPFVRAEEARQGKPGAGLGLAIVQRIVNLHAGRLALLSPPPGESRGLLVQVLLPLAGQCLAEPGKPT